MAGVSTAFGGNPASFSPESDFSMENIQGSPQQQMSANFLQERNPADFEQEPNYPEESTRRFSQFSHEDGPNEPSDFQDMRGAPYQNEVQRNNNGFEDSVGMNENYSY